MKHFNFILFVVLFQISCVSASTEQINRERFPFYYQMLPVEADIVPGFFQAIRTFGWRHVGIIVQNEDAFTVVCVVIVYARNLILILTLLRVG